MPPRFHRAATALSLLMVCLGAAGASGQEVADAVLSGRVLVGSQPLTAATVVLHQVNDVVQGEIDSTRVAADGTFRLRLPSVPNPMRGEMFFASVRHQGVLYFGQALAQAVQLDSTYLIQAYDTLLAPAEGVSVAIESRSLFFEADGPTWRITDVFQLRNDRDRTVVARPGGRVWSYPLPITATEVITGEGEMSADVVTYQEGSLVARAALPPGERLFVVRYTLATPEVEIPTPGTTELFDVLVREPAPPLEVVGLTPAESVELETGATYRRFEGAELSISTLRIMVGEERGPPPVQWIAVVLTLVLAAGGLMAFRGRSRAPRPTRAATDHRQAVLVELARLDEDFESRRSPSGAVRQEYQMRRAELMRRLKPGA